MRMQLTAAQLQLFPGGPKTCSEDECADAVYAKGFCQRHYKQVQYLVHKDRGRQRLTPAVKTCTRCGETKESAHFSYAWGNRDGLNNACKACIAARVRDYYAKHPERKKASARKDYDRHGQAIRRHVRQYASENLEVVRARKRDYYRRNKSRWIGMGTARRRRHPLPDKLAVAYMIALRGDPCCYCGQPMDHIDHIVPVAEGGSNEWDNLTAACERCNRAKYTRPLIEFMRERYSWKGS